jgi:hypothetical protein
MCRLVSAAVTLITIHALSKDLATTGASTCAKPSPVRPRTLVIFRPKSTAAEKSLLRQVQACIEGMFPSCVEFCAQGPKPVPLADL